MQLLSYWYLLGPNVACKLEDIIIKSDQYYVRKWTVDRETSGGVDGLSLPEYTWRSTRMIQCLYLIISRDEVISYQIQLGTVLFL